MGKKMSDKELTLKDFGGEVLGKDKDGNPTAVYIHNEVQSKPTITDFNFDIISLVNNYPNDMKLGGEVRKYVMKYEEENHNINHNINQIEMDFSKSEYHDDQATKDRKRWGG